jgi:hypothetical protein
MRTVAQLNRPSMEVPSVWLRPLRISDFRCRRLVTLATGLIFAAAAVGCVPKGEAKAEAHAAYLEGQRDALMRLQQPQLQGPSVMVNGPVRNSIVPWTPRLTLSQAILAADYQAPGDPADIIVIHNGRGVRVNVRNLLDGQDMSLQPGDVVQLVSAYPTAESPGSPRGVPGVAPQVPGPSPEIPGPSPVVPGR